MGCREIVLRDAYLREEFILTGRGTGLTLTERGYLRIVRGKMRHTYAHRAYVERQLGRKLLPNEEVHHDCRNKQCWPPSDFHLVIMDEALHQGSQLGGNLGMWARRYERKKRYHFNALEFLKLTAKRKERDA